MVSYGITIVALSDTLIHFTKLERVDFVYLYKINQDVDNGLMIDHIRDHYFLSKNDIMIIACTFKIYSRTISVYLVKS